MSPAEHRRLDEATIAALTRTSWQNERDHLRDCAACGKPFWARGWSARYCSGACRCRAYYVRQRPWVIARALARYRALVAAQEVA